MMLAQASVPTEADQIEQALKVYRDLLEDPGVAASHRKSAETALAVLNQK